MPNAIPYKEIDNWTKIGRGRGFDFYATLDEMQQWLLTELPPAYGPYELVGSDLVGCVGQAYYAPFRYDIKDLRACALGTREQQGIRCSYIWAHDLTPNRSLHKGEQIPGFCALNGMIGVTTGRCFCGSISIVPLVVNMDTGEERVHEGYLEAFNALKKVIKRKLVYESVFVEDWKDIWRTNIKLMTEDAAKLHDKYRSFKVCPGKRVRKCRRSGAMTSGAGCR